MLNEHFNKIRISMLAKADEMKIAGHPVVSGTARELILSEFLTKNLPRAFDCSSGEVISPSGERSGQIDIMIAPHYSPVLNLGENTSINLLHGIAVALEVKTRLTTGINSSNALNEALENCRKLKSLNFEIKHSPHPWTGAIGSKNISLQHVPYCVVCVDGPTKETLIEKVAGVSHDLLPDTITCLRRNYYLTKAPEWQTSNPPQIAGHYHSLSGDALFSQFDFLMKVLQAWDYARPRTPLSLYS